MSDTRLAGRVALVTGANNPLGIGAATARALAAEGAGVFVAFFRPPATPGGGAKEGSGKPEAFGPAYYEAAQRETPDALLRDIRAAGGRAACLEADLSDPSSIPALFDACESSLGPVEILVNNHAHWLPETFDPAAVGSEGFGMRLADAATMDVHYAINARAPALLMAEFLRRHLKRGATWGRVVNVSTDAADAHVGAVSYAASKHALESYSRSAAHELGKYGITVNVVAPGPVQTGWLTPDQEIDLGRRTPLGRVGRPEDIADVIAFLASERARWLTGQLLYVGGGWKWHP